MSAKFVFRRLFILSAFVFALGVFSIWKIVSVSEAGKTSAVLIPSISATKTDTVSTDNDSDGRADPGDTLKYTVTITNGGTDATGVIFQDILSSTLTLVGGSVNTTPISAADAYNTIGNVNISVPNGTGDLLDNDIDPDTGSGTALTATVETKKSAQCVIALCATDNVSISADGSFTYDPPPGFTGSTDTFTYTARDSGVDGIPNNADDGTTTGTATITIAGRIWFINSAAATNGNGTLASPFKCLVGGGCFDPAAADAANDNIFLYSGTYTDTGALTLLGGQKLIGQGASDTLLNIAALSAPSGTNLLPGTNLPPGSGANPIITSSGTGITLSTGNTIRGLTVGTVGTGAGNAKIVGTSFGTLTLGNSTAPDVTLNGAGQALSLTTGTFAATSALSGLTTTSSVSQGVNLAGIAGTISFGSTTVSGNPTQCIQVGTTTANINFGNTSCTGGTDGVSLQNNSSGTRTFGTLSVSGGSGSAFLHANGGGNVTVSGAATLAGSGNPVDIQNSGAAAINFAGGATVSKTTAGGAGVNLVASSVTFDSLGITTSNGTGLSATTSGTVTVTNGTKAISATGVGTQVAPGISASSVTLNANFSSVTSTNSGGTGTGISLATVSGALTVTTTNIQNPGGVGISETSSAGNHNFGATTVNGSGSTGVVLGGTGTGNSGTTTFGAITVTPDSGQRGVFAQQNTGAITSASGTVTTTNNTAVEITGTSTASKTPLNIQLTTVNTTGGATAANGIRLVNTSATGSPGGFRVLGTGGTCDATTPTCTGGRITNTTGADSSAAAPAGAGVSLDNAASVVLTSMRIDNHPNYGIRGSVVSGFTLSNSLVSTNGTNQATPFNDSSIYFNDLSGTSSINTSEVTGGYQRNIYIDNTIGALDLTVNACNIHNSSNAQGDDGLAIEIGSSGGASSATVRVTNNTFSAHGGDHFDFTALESPTVSVVFTGNSGNPGSPVHPIGLGQGFRIAAGAFNGTLTYDMSNNTVNGTKQGNAIAINKGSGTGTFSGRVSGNTIGSSGQTLSGASQSTGISVESRGGGTHTTLVSNNTVRQYRDRGILIEGAEAGTTTMNATVTGNTVDEQGSPGAAGATLRGIELNWGIDVGNTSTACVDIVMNNVPNSGNEAAGFADIGLRQRQSTTVRLPGYTGANNNNAAVVSYLSGRNTLTLATAGNTVPTGGGYVNTPGGAACPQPTIPAPLASLVEKSGDNSIKGFNDNLSFLNSSYQTPSEILASIEPFVKYSATAEIVSSEEIAMAETTFASETVSESETIEMPETSYLSSIAAFVSDTSNAIIELTGKLGDSISPTVIAQEVRRESAKKQLRGDLQATAPQAVQTVCVDGNTNSATCTGGFSLPAGKSITITFNATISANPPFPSPALTSVSNQGSVSGSNFTSSPVLTDDPAVAGTANPTVRQIDSTTVSVASNPNPSVFGQSATFTATLTGAPVRASDPTGTVQFKADGNNIGSPAAVVIGTVGDNTSTAQASIASLSVGSHVITAEYSGGGSGATGYNANIGTLAGNQVVNKADSSVGLTSSANPSVAAQAVTFTATVAAVAPGAGTPSGTVQFKDGAADIGSPQTLNGSGAASLTTSALSVGNHTISANYLGDGNFKISSGNLTGNPQVVNKAAIVYVDDSFAGSSDAQDLGGGKIFGRNAFATINNGLNNVAAGGTLNVADGTYAETVGVNQNINVVGTGNITLSGSLSVLNGLWTSTSGVFSITGHFTHNTGTFNAGGGTFVLNGSAAQIIDGAGSTVFNNLTVNNAAGVTLNGSITVGGVFTLQNGIMSTGTTTLTLTTAATSIRDGGCAITTCFVTSGTGGGFKKQFSSAPTASFIFHVGDNGWSPVSLANATATTGTGELTVRAVDAVSPAAIATPKISRYWALTGLNLTADISFTYLNGDITPTDETKLRVYKETANQCAADCVDDATNTGTVTGVNSFSNWTLAEAVALPPTAAEATISGRVLNSSGRGIGKVTVMLSGGNLTEPRYAMTDYAGNYRFAEVTVGQDYVVTPIGSRYRFEPNAKVQSLTEDLSDVNFIGSRQSP